MDNRPEGSIVTIGTFDGVHRGHMAVLECLHREGARLGLCPVVVTFDRHPLELVAPERTPGLIMDIDRRDGMLRDTGARVMRVPFTGQVRDMRCRDWLTRLRGELGMQALVIGYDNTFGSDGRSMSHQDYVQLGSELGVMVFTAPYVEGCSSSAVRKALMTGDVEQAAALLGRPFSLEGIVTQGSHIGRTIGVPTANIAPDRHLLMPAHGVYAAVVITEDDVCWDAVVNIGVNPTVSDRNELRVEAHLLDFSGDLYDKRLKVSFLKRMREERHFGSLDELKQVLHSDIERRRRELP